MELKEKFELVKQARELAYAPYSKFKVGALVILNNGKYYTGCNIENAAYGLCNCAERTALFKAYSEGVKKEDISELVIIADTDRPCSPCGSCRQVMSELMKENAKVTLFNLKGESSELTVKELLPYAFNEGDLNE